MIVVLCVALALSSAVTATVYESYVDNSFHSNNASTVYGQWSSVIDAGTAVYYATIVNTTLNISGAIVRSAYLYDGLLTFGWIDANGYTYFAPYNVTHIEQGLPPASSGYLLVNNSVPGYGSTVLVKYYGELGSNVTLNASSAASTGSAVTMTDSDADGVYEASILVDQGGSAYQTIAANITDRFGNPFAVNLTFFVDSGAPTGTVAISAGATYTTTRFVVLSLNISDNYLLRDCTVSTDTDFSDNVPATCADAFSHVLNTSDGTQWVFVRVRDLAGNTLLINDSIIADLTDLNLTLSIPAPYAYVNKTLNVTFTGMENAPQISVDGGAFIATTGSTYHVIDTLLLYDGVHMVQVRDTALSGQTGYTQLVSFVVDNTDPYVAFDTSRLAAGYYTRTRNLSFDLRDSASGINLSTLNATLNGGASALAAGSDCTSDGNGGYVCTYVETNAVSEQENTLAISVRDRTSNSYAAAFSFYADTTLPNVTVHEPVGTKNTHSVLVNVTTHENATCTVTASYQGNNASFEQQLGALTPTQHLGTYYAAEGSTNLFIRCEDLSGNYRITNQTFTVIATEASVVSSSPSGDVATQAPTLNVTTDRAVTCRYDTRDRDYDSMANTFASTGGTVHTQPLSLIEGDHFYFVRCRETSGLTMSQSTFLFFTIDVSSPYVVFSSPSGITGSNLTRFTAYDAGSGVDNATFAVSHTSGASVFSSAPDCTSNGMMGYVCTYNDTYADAPLVTVTINVSDHAGNAYSDTFSFTYDTAAPNITVLTPDDWYGQDVRTLNITVDENASCRYNDIVQGNTSFARMSYLFSGGLSLSAVAHVYNGYNRYYVACKDDAGNIASEEINFTADLSVPAVNITNLPNQTVINGTYWIAYIVVDPFGGGYTCEIAIDGGSWNVSAASPYAFNSTQYRDGVHTVQVRCNDTVQNVGYSRIRTINVDNTPSSVFLLDRYDNEYLSGMVTLRAIGPDNLDYVVLRINNGTDIGTFFDYDADFTFTVNTSAYPDGYINLVVEGYDEEGYLIDTDVVLAIFDNQVPAFTTTLANDSVLSSSYAVNVSTSDADIDRVVFRYRYNGVWYPLSTDYAQPFGTLWRTSLYPDGAYDVNVTAYDRSGHDTTLSYTNLTLINTVPSVTITDPAGGQTLAGVHAVQFSASHTFPITTTLSIDGGTFVPTTTSSSHTLDTTAYADGQHLLIVRANDSYGNAASDEVLVTFLNAEQSIYIVDPAQGEKVFGATSVEAIASSYAQKVRFSLVFPNGTSVELANDTTGRDGFTHLLNTGAFADGWYLINASSYDASGAFLSYDHVNVTFDNQINFTPVCDPVLIDYARLSLAGDTDLTSVLYEYDAGSGYNLIGRALTAPYQTFWYGTGLVNGNYTVRVTGTDGANTLVKNCSVEISKISLALSLNKTYVKNGDGIAFIYEGVVLGLNITMNTSTFDTNSGLVAFHDDGLGADLFANDAIYAGEYNVSAANANPDGKYNATAVIGDFGNTFNASVSLYLDNTAPNVTFSVNNNDTYLYVPSKAMSAIVLLTSVFNDNFGIDACRYRTSFTLFGAWESCVVSKSFLLPSIQSAGAGNRTVYAEVRDWAGNVRALTDDLYLNFSDYDAALNDTTAPNAPNVTLANATKGTFRVRWSGSIDPESFILLYRLRYCYTIGTDSGDVDETILSGIYPDYGCGAGYRLSGTDGSDEFADIDIPALGVSVNATTDYYFKVKVYNGIGLMNYTIAGPFRIDDQAPSNVTLTAFPTNTFSVYNETTVSGTSLFYAYNATDNLAVAGFYYTLDARPDTQPYDITPRPGNVTFADIATGLWYFHVAAVDGAGNVGAVLHRNVTVDNTPPTAPALISKDEAAGENFTINYTASTDAETGLEYYVIELDDNQSFSSVDYTFNTTNTSYFVTNNLTITYYLRVKAVNRVNLSSAWSGTGSRVVDVTAPAVVSQKAGGQVVQHDVAFNLETDEDATCSFVQSAICPGANSSSWTRFTFTGGIHHGQYLNSVGGKTYCFRCVDLVGNTLITNTTTFTYQNVPASFTVVMSIAANDSVYVGELVVMNVTVTDGAGMGEINKNRVLLHLANSEDSVAVTEFSLTDQGSGSYQISFYAPQLTGSVDVLLSIYDVDTTATMSVSDLALAVDYAPVSALTDPDQSSSQNEKFPFGLTFAKGAGHVVGIATEGYPTNISGLSTELRLDSRISKGNIYLFLTPTDTHVKAKIPLLQSKRFEREGAPSFGSVDTSPDEQSVRTRIEYDRYILVGAGELEDGLYALKIRKIGDDETTGKPIIEVTVQ